MEIPLVGGADVRGSVSMEEAIPPVEGALTQHPAGEVNLAPAMNLEMTHAGGKLHRLAGPA